MTPPVFEAVKDDSAVKAIFGSVPRVYPFGEAPPNVQKPYAVWQLAYGSPENFLGQRPDIDNYGTQIDVYAPTAASARGAAMALRDALEPVGHIVSWSGEGRDPDTRDYRYSFTVEFWSAR